MDPQPSSPSSDNRLMFEALMGHIDKVLSKKFESIVLELEQLKLSKEHSSSRSHGHHRAPSLLRVSEAIPNPFPNAHHANDSKHVHDLHRQPRQDPFFGHGMNARHGNMHDISSEDDDLHDIPRHPGPRPNKHHQGNILDHIPLFGDPTLENRHIGAKLDIPSFDGSTNPEKYHG